MHKSPLIPVTIGIALLLAGCGDQRVLERLGFTQTTSYDLIPMEEKQTDNLLKIAVSIPKTDPEGKIKREEIVTVARSSKEARIQLSQKTELILVSGQLRNTLFGIDMAKKGLWKHIDTLVRDPAISGRVKIIVVNGEAYDLLKSDYPEHPRTGQYIDRMLTKESKVQTVPRVTLYQFTRDYYDDGIDPVAPIIIKADGVIKIDGIALFDGDKYISKIEPENALIFAILRGNFNRGEISIDVGEEGDQKESVLFSSVISRRKISVERKNDQFVVNININIKGSILEYLGELQLFKETDRQKLADQIGTYISKETERLLKEMQKKNVDSIGMGQYVRNSMSYTEWKSLDWKQLYPNVEVHCYAKVKIKDYGKFK